MRITRTTQVATTLFALVMFTTNLPARAEDGTTASTTETTTTTETRTDTPAPRRPAPRQKQWVWLARQGVYGYGYQVTQGRYKGLWRIDPGSKRTPAELAATSATDPYGFAAYLNAYRVSAGLQPVAYDAELSQWAAANNAQQASRGLGHHVNPNCLQNSAWNTPDAASTASTWLSSPAHLQNMTAPSATRFGIAYGPGPYWTLNLR